MVRRSDYETIVICSGHAAGHSNIRPDAGLSAVEFSATNHAGAAAATRPITTTAGSDGPTVAGSASGPSRTGNSTSISGAARAVEREASCGSQSHYRDRERHGGQ